MDAIRNPQNEIEVEHDEDAILQARRLAAVHTAEADIERDEDAVIAERRRTRRTHAAAERYALAHRADPDPVLINAQARHALAEIARAEWQDETGPTRSK